MNTFFVKTLRIMMLFLFIISLALGYVIYEDTLAVWWIPVGVALLIALATLPFYRKWSWLTTTEGKVMNVRIGVDSSILDSDEGFGRKADEKI